MNPLVNAGAISSTSMVRGASADEVWKKNSIGFHDRSGRLFAERPAGRLTNPSRIPATSAIRLIGRPGCWRMDIKADWRQAVDLCT